MNNRVCDFRKLHGLTQEKLSLDLGVSRQTVIAIENNKFNPSLDLAFKISKKFQVSIEELFLHSEI